MDAPNAGRGPAEPPGEDVDVVVPRQFEKSGNALGALDQALCRLGVPGVVAQSLVDGGMRAPETGAAARRRRP